MRYTLDKKQSGYIRTTPDGCTIYHFTCPLCIHILHTADTDMHLGVGCRAGRVIFSRCFRCGSTPQVSLSGEEPYREPRKPIEIPESIALTDLPDSSVLVQAMNTMRLSLNIWAGLTLDDLREAGLRIQTDNPYRVWLPYRTQTDVGIQVRIFNHTGPKILTIGPKGPANLPSRHAGTTVIVEGWADGAAIPWPYAALLLLGCDNARGVVPPHQAIIFLDPDASGAKGTSVLVHTALREGREVSIVPPDLCAGQDPAQLGKERVSHLLKAAVPIRKLSDLRKVLEGGLTPSEAAVPSGRKDGQTSKNLH